MKKTLTSQGLSIPNALLTVLSTAIICVSIYLIKHFFDANFPSSLESSSSLCSLGSFLNCDSATFSPMAHFGGVPTGVFGLIFGLCILIGVFAGSEKLEQQNKLLTLLNALGCLLFLAYSLFVLKTLCPFCTVYYVLSWIVWFIYHRQSHLPYLLDVKHGLWQLALLAVLGGFFSYNYHETSAKHGKSSERIIQEYKGLATLGSPDVESLFYIQKTTSAPKVTISIFSDFQCPFCKKISEQMHEISRRFKDTLQINYYFFPLDGSCNSEIKGNMHPLACLAAKIASCDQNKFLEVHDKIFSSQENLSETLLEDIRKSFQLDNCPPQEDFIKLVASHVAVAKSFNVKSTPTFILNGKKIEGMIPSNHLAAIIEDLIKN